MLFTGPYFSCQLALFTPAPALLLWGCWHREGGPAFQADESVGPSQALSWLALLSRRKPAEARVWTFKYVQSLRSCPNKFSHKKWWEKGLDLNQGPLLSVILMYIHSYATKYIRTMHTNWEVTVWIWLIDVIFWPEQFCCYLFIMEYF